MLFRVLILFSLSLFIVGLGVWMMRALDESSKEPARLEIASARFACNGGKTIEAVFYAARRKAATRAGRPPRPGGSVHVSLSDGRMLDLEQTISADGARYAQTDGTLVFWNKGNGAFILENDRQTYFGCIAVAPDPGGLPKVYENGAAGFSIRYPANYTLQADYTYRALGPGAGIDGVKFTVAPSSAAGTNLSPDSYLSVEEIPRAPSCTAARFLPEGAPPAEEAKEGGTTYSVAKSTDAAAGNRYEETVLALPGTKPCIAVRYFVHYAVLQNYPPGAVREFDRKALLAQFNAMRRTLIVQQ
jgi:hypothetical protein